MKRFAIAIAALCLILGAGDVVAQQARLLGQVTDVEGNPVEGAQVKLHSARYENMPIIETDSRGEWGAILPVGGTWNIDVMAEGYQTSLGTLQVSAVSRNPKVRTELSPKAVPVEVPAETELQSSVPDEALEAVKTAEEYLRNVQGRKTVVGEDGAEQVVEGEMPSEKEKVALYKAAIAEFEKAQALLPEHLELKKALARAYYGAGEIEPAIGLLDDVLEVEPDNMGIALLQVNLLAEAGRLEDAKAVLDGLPSGALEDPTAVINVGILFLNKGEPTAAIDYLDKAIEIDPTSAVSYYYRGMAHLQNENMDSAKADFEKVVALDPDSPEAADAQGMLEYLG